jgi:cysteine sulfinate desulfinase/cysteine desulfurase-like protein
MSSQHIGSGYLDHAATTPMRLEAIAAMTEELARLGNPSSLHAAGRRACTGRVRTTPGGGC